MRIISSLIILLTIVGHTVQAQTKDLLIGQWDYESTRKIGAAEQPVQSMLKIVAANNDYLQFQRNNRYVLYENSTYTTGEWKFSQGNTKLVLTPHSGKTITFDIISINKHTLVLLSSGNIYSTFIRHGSADSKTAAQVYPTEETIIRKWILIELQDSLENVEVNQKLSEFVKGGWFEFRENGVYAKKVITHEKRGEWKLQNENRTIVMVDEDGFGSVYNICFISPAKLVLQKPGSSTRHVFAALH